MNFRFLTYSCLCLAITTSVGCSSFKSLVSQRTDLDDPLSEPGTTSDEYRAAKRELKKQAPSTVLAFAQWKEDIGNFEEAKTRYNDVLSDDPNNVDARIGVARVEFKTGRKQEAKRILTATVKKFPESKSAWLELGRLHAKQEQWESAISGLGRAVKLAPTDRVINYELGVALTHNNQLEEAHKHLAIAGGDSAASYNIGFLLHDKGRSSEAAEWTQRALGSKPDPQTRASAEKLLAVLNRGPNQTMLASQSRTQARPTINKELTSYQSYQERPSSNGFAPSASAATSGIVSLDNGPMISPGGSSNISTRQTDAIRTASMQRVLPSESFQGSNQLPSWHGPSTTPTQQQVSPASVSQQPVSDPPQWKRSR